MSEQGFSLIGTSKNDSIWTAYMTSPFYPSITKKAPDSYKLEFAQAYIFDYANADKLKEPIKIKAKELTLSKTGNKKFYVKLEISGETGKISSATIEQITDPSNAPDEIKQLPVKDKDSTLTSVTWYLPLAEFEGISLKKIYLRENLHLNFRKFEQLGAYDPNNIVPIISKIKESKEANTPIAFYSIAKSEKAGNTLEISLNESRGTIDLYVSGSYY